LLFAIKKGFLYTLKQWEWKPPYTTQV